MGIQEISFIPKTYDLCCSMNVKGKYALTKEPTLATTFVYVLDDVLTSGSTFNEIFGVLAQYCLGYSSCSLALE